MFTSYISYGITTTRLRTFRLRHFVYRHLVYIHVYFVYNKNIYIRYIIYKKFQMAFLNSNLSPISSAMTFFAEIELSRRLSAVSVSSQGGDDLRNEVDLTASF